MHENSRLFAINRVYISSRYDWCSSPAFAAKTSGKLSVLGVNRPDRSLQEFLILSRESRRKVSTAWRWRPKLATSSPRLVSPFSLRAASERAVSTLHVLRICTLLAVILQRSYICLPSSFSPRTFSPVTLSRKPESLFNPRRRNSESGLGDYHTNSAGPHASNVARHTHASGSVCGICGFSETPELNFN